MPAHGVCAVVTGTVALGHFQVDVNLSFDWSAITEDGTAEYCRVLSRALQLVSRTLASLSFARPLAATAYRHESRSASEYGCYENGKYSLPACL